MPLRGPPPGLTPARALGRSVSSWLPAPLWELTPATAHKTGQLQPSAGRVRCHGPGATAWSREQKGFSPKGGQEKRQVRGVRKIQRRIIEKEEQENMRMEGVESKIGQPSQPGSHSCALRWADPDLAVSPHDGEPRTGRGAAAVGVPVTQGGVSTSLGREAALLTLPRVAFVAEPACQPETGGRIQVYGEAREEANNVDEVGGAAPESAGRAGHILSPTPMATLRLALPSCSGADSSILTCGSSQNCAAMESKLLIGGRNIMDHTNEQQKMLELKRQEIAEQKRREREMQQAVLLRDEETMELRETFSSLQQEVEIKTKKLKKLYTKLQAVKAEIQDQHEEYIRVRQDLEEAQNEQTRELKLKYLIIENFIPPEEKNKIMNRLYFDCEEDQWKFQPLVLAAAGRNSSSSAAATGTQMKKRPTSAVGYKRPISQHARLAMSMGSHPRYRAENILFLELDVSPPAVFEFESTRDQSEHDPRALHLERLMRLDSLLERPAASQVRKSRSWCQSPRALPASATHVSLASSSQNPCATPAHE
ncbi:kinesin-like protein KIF3C [Varanus komodoensis]|uniref:kinesin-like protein KIF3C n=1 Tax=Varanus komodoensis TaxID=61221 RepID=UPI001CF7A63D|nr:kinesin-like protein KIF3C [Varanus komodoensis]